MKYLLRPFWALLIVLLAACRSAAAEPTATATPEPQAVFTAAAQTAAARMTELAALTPTLPTVTPSLTPQPATPTQTLSAATSTTTLTPAPAGSDRVEFVADVTVPDGTNFRPGERFTKTWRVKNAGTSTWTTAYALVFASGAPLGGPQAVAVPMAVPPGAIIDLSVDLTAPSDPGSYTSNWLLRNAAGVNFGLGPEAKWPIYAQINVVGATTPGPTPTGATSGRVVSAVALSVDQASVETDCPHTFNFTGQITLSQAATVTYQLEAETGFNW